MDILARNKADFINSFMELEEEIIDPREDGSVII